MVAPQHLEAWTGAQAPLAISRVWYMAYGSNMHLARFRHYLCGGRPPGGARVYPGSRDTAAPMSIASVVVPGSLYFAWESRVWTGGVAFYDPDVPGEVAARVYLIKLSQFSDIAVQEMYRDPATDIDITGALCAGRAQLGPGRYETLLCPGALDGLPVLTFTAPWGMREVPWSRPSAGYLRHLASGLMEAHDWDIDRIVRYLGNCPGVAGSWTSVQLAALAADILAADLAVTPDQPCPDGRSCQDLGTKPSD